jgi:hypothetical protein
MLACGILSPLLYIASDVVASARYRGYSYFDQTISELNAFGAPTRGFTIAIGLVVYVVLIVFGLGVRKASAGNRRLRVAGTLLAGMGAFSLWAVPFASMQMRGEDQGPAHVIAGGVAVLMLLSAIGLSAAALGGRFRLYSILSIAIMLGFGAWSGMDGSLVAEGLATPWLGIKERISVYSYQVWIMAFALALLARGAAVERFDRTAHG